MPGQDLSDLERVLIDGDLADGQMFDAAVEDASGLGRRIMVRGRSPPAEPLTALLDRETEICAFPATRGYLRFEI